MDGGRGKGKKSKTAKKKAAAASQAAGNQKKVATSHGAKKVNANHSNVQVVAVSGAQEAANSTAPHDQTMTKSKRKRLKKLAGAANALLKKQAAAEALMASQTQVQQAKKSPTAAGSTASPKTKVAVLTSPVVKSHVVSLTGAKKKKRKRNTSSVTESGETVHTTASPKEGQLSEGNKSPKTVAVLGTSPAGAKTKPVVAATASPKRKSAQVHAQKTENVTTSDASVKARVVANLRKPVKVKVKPMEVSGIPAGTASTTVSPQEVQVPVKSDVQQSESSVTTAPAKVTKPETTTQKGNIIDQVDNTTKKSSAYPPLHATKVVANEKHDAVVTMSSKADVVTIPLKKVAPKKKTTASTATAATTVNSEDKLSSPPAINAAVATRDPLSNPAHVAPATLTASSVANEKAASQEPVRSVATSATSTSLPASVATASSPNRNAAKLSESPLVDTKVSNATMLPRGGIKRRRPTDQATTSVDVDSFQPPAKRNAVASKGSVIQPKAVQLTGSNNTQLSADKQAGAPDQPTNSRTLLQHIVCTAKRPQPGGAPVEETHEANMVVAAPSVKVIASSSAARGNVDKGELRNQTQSAAKKPMKLASEHKNPSVQAHITSSKVTQPTIKKPKPIVTTNTGTSVANMKIGEEVDRHCPPSESESAAKTKKVDIMDSHAYVQKMMMDDQDMNKHGSNNVFRPTERTVVLPPRPQNVWGASFGMVPPVRGASSTLRTLATTPLSSWFLSKGCANFVKQVHFSDDDDDDNSSYDDGSVLTQSLTTPRSFDKTPPKRRVSIAKKNAFLESLTTQSNWRTWYGNVDLHNLLDPPLPCVPEKLRTHEVTPLALPEPAIGNGSVTSTKKTNELDMLEADIRREKQRGSAFSDQLLMMLQGKTVSGKFLEEEYSPLLH